MYLKVIGVVHVILAFLKLLLQLKLICRWLLQVLVLGSSDGSMSTHEHMAKNNTQHKHTSKQVQTLRNSTTIHKNSKQN